MSPDPENPEFTTLIAGLLGLVLALPIAALRLAAAINLGHL